MVKLLLEFSNQFLTLQTAPLRKKSVLMRWDHLFGGVLLTVALTLSCSKKGGGDEGDGTGNPEPDGWMLVSWNDDTAIAGHVYLQLSDNLFTLYQAVGDLATAGYRQYTGTYTLTEDPDQGLLLSGEYSGGTPWVGGTYVVETWTESELRLRSLDEGIVSVYAWEVIPEYVKRDPVTTASRSVGSEEPFL